MAALRIPESPNIMKKGILFLLLGTVAILFAVVGFPAYLFWHLSSFNLDEEGVLLGAEKQFVAPGEIEVSFDQPGHYILWYQYQATFEGERYRFSPEIPPGLEVAMEEVDAGAAAQWIAFGDEMDFTIEMSDVGRKHTGVFQVDIPGTYHLVVAGEFEPRVFSIATTPMDELIGGVGTLFVAAVLVGLIGLGLLILGIVVLLKGRQPRPERPPEPGS